MNIIAKLIITQVSSGFVSLIASSTIVTFVIIKGFSSPYRRIIFGLSVSDILLSLGIITGPFLIQSEGVPQAIWGIGNQQSCQFSGFLFLMGMNTVPMYTLCLCIYYVCKCKSKMSDDAFTHRVEKKMHIAIVATNLIFYFMALWMGAIGPGAMGNACLPAAAPAGCRINPDKYGECDPFIELAAKIFNVIATAIIPITSLAGIIWCLAILFCNVIMMERVSGGAQALTQAQTQVQTQAYSGGSISSGGGGGKMQRNRFLRSSRNALVINNSVENSDMTLVTSMGGGGGDPKSSSLDAQEGKDCIAIVSSAEDEHEQQHESNLHTIAELPAEHVFRYANSDTEHEPNIDANEGSDADVDGISRRDLGSVSRLYKKELMIQALCYVLVFCMSTSPFLASNIYLLSGVQIPIGLVWFTAVFYPLAGLFNIIVYTRLNVAGFRQKHPECSRFMAFWWVLKAGGEMPDDDEWNQNQRSSSRSTSGWNLNCCRINCVISKSSNNNSPPHPPLNNEEHCGNLDHPSNSLGDENRDQLEKLRSESRSPEESAIKCQEVCLSIPQSGKISKNMNDKSVSRSSVPDSAVGMNGMSQSFDDENPAHRPCNHWDYAQGGMMETSSSSNKNLELKQMELLIRIPQKNDHSVNVSSISHASISHGHDNKASAGEKEDIWANTFERVKRWQPSE